MTHLFPQLYVNGNVDSIAKFKTELRKRKDISQVPKHYEIGPRKINIIYWHDNDKRDLKLYLLGTNRNSKKKQNIEAG
jgi:hypothetical protein